MNSCTLKGVLTSISKEFSFGVDGEYKYKLVKFHLIHPEGDTSKKLYVVTNMWYDIDLPEIGTKCEFTFKISSAPNTKDPDYYFHKINLTSVKLI